MVFLWFSYVNLPGHQAILWLYQKVLSLVMVILLMVDSLLVMGDLTTNHQALVLTHY